MYRNLGLPWKSVDGSRSLSGLRTLCRAVSNANIGLISQTNIQNTENSNARHFPVLL